MPAWKRLSTWFTVLLLLFMAQRQPGRAQSAPPSPEHPWRYSAAQEPRGSGLVSEADVSLETGRIWSLAELIDLAEAHNPQTRAAPGKWPVPRQRLWESRAANCFPCWQ